MNGNGIQLDPMVLIEEQRRLIVSQMDEIVKLRALVQMMDNGQPEGNLVAVADDEGDGKDAVG